MRISGLTCSIGRFAAISMALALVFSLGAALIPAGLVSAAIFDIPDGDVAQLIAAINTANTNGEADTINLAVNGTYTLNISDNNTDGPNGLPSINSTITINGNGATIQRDSAGGTDNFRIFHVAATGNVSMFNMTIRNGNTTSDGGGLYNDGGEVMMTNCTIRDNNAYNAGGLDNEYGIVTMTNCVISGNTADDGSGSGYGGGIYNYSYPNNMTMTNCTVSGNTASVGGGIYANSGELLMTNCTVSGNTADDGSGYGCGGGIYNSYGDVTMTNCTVSGNTAEDNGGSIWCHYGEMWMINCTIIGNTATTGVGGGIYDNGEFSIVEIYCTIVYGNDAPTDPNLHSAWPIIDSESIVDEPVGSAPDPLLGLLQDNGGPTETHALLAGSPAIDACVTGCTVDSDQRGVSRPQLTACDVGAYEYQQQSTLPVGGTVEPVDRIGILAPWLVLAALMAVSITIVVVVRRRMA